MKKLTAHQFGILQRLCEENIEADSFPRAPFARVVSEGWVNVIDGLASITSLGQSRYLADIRRFGPTRDE